MGTDTHSPLPRRNLREADRRPVNGRAGQWYRGSTTILAGTPENVAAARRHVTTAATLPPPVSETVALLTSEIVTNTLRHTRSGQPGGEVMVGVWRLCDRVQVTVIDDGPSPESPAEFPHLRPLDPVEMCREHGRGLHIVDDQATCWDAFREPDGRTTVWFECAV